MGLVKTAVVPATRKMIDNMVGRLREADHEECMASNGCSADTGLRRSFETSDVCWVATLDGQPVFAFGVSRTSILCGTGHPWLLGTDGILKVGRETVRQSKRYVQEMLSRVDMLENWVDNRNTVSIKWLKWCGFKFDKAAPFGIKQKMFRRFYMMNGGNI